MNKYRRIKYEDRCQIYALSKRGSSQESIAEVLGVSQSAVSREMQRNCGQRGYRFKQAEAKSQARQAIWPAPGSADTELGVLMEPEVCHGETEVYAGV